MAAIGAYDPQAAMLSTPAPAASTSNASAAAPQAPARQVGFSGTSSLDPVKATVDGANSEASSRSDLASSDFKIKDAILGKNFMAHGWHDLMKELISLLK